MNRVRLLAASSAVWAGLAPAPASAHLVSTRFGDFYGGLLHVLMTLEHVLPLLALGLLAGLQEPRSGRWILASAPLGLLCGLLLAAVQTGTAIPLDWMNKASFVILGLLVAAAWRLPPALLAGLGWLFGLTHGYGNGLAMTPETTVVPFVLGVVAGGVVLIALAAAAVVALTERADWVRIAVRAAGSWIAAIGLMVSVV